LSFKNAIKLQNELAWWSRRAEALHLVSSFYHSQGRWFRNPLLKLHTFWSRRLVTNIKRSSQLHKHQTLAKLASRSYFSIVFKMYCSAFNLFFLFKTVNLVPFNCKIGLYPRLRPSSQSSLIFSGFILLLNASLPPPLVTWSIHLFLITIHLEKWLSFVGFLCWFFHY